MSESTTTLRPFSSRANWQFESSAAELQAVQVRLKYPQKTSSPSIKMMTLSENSQPLPPTRSTSPLHWTSRGRTSLIRKRSNPRTTGNRDYKGYRHQLQLTRRRAGSGILLRVMKPNFLLLLFCCAISSSHKSPNAGNSYAPKRLSLLDPPCA